MSAATTYSTETLKAMARQALAAKSAGDSRCLELVVRLSLTTGHTMPMCEHLIRKLAENGRA